MDNEQLTMDNSPMPLDRATKPIAQRIDLSYPNRPHPLRTLRRTLVVLCALVASIWAAWNVLAKNQRIYNPGPVTVAHAMYENNCTLCHDGNGQSTFNQSVSDAACLKCHPAAIHADKQTTLVSFNSANNPVSSSNCMQCHVEHKGHDALIGASDLLCAKCHDNLQANVATGHSPLPNTVRSFAAPPAHPPFGRRLLHEGQLTDPTPLKFNHAKHQSQGLTDCTTCHQPSPDHRTKLPVDYAAHCQSCHPLTMRSSPQDNAVILHFTHADMNSIRGQLANLPQMLAQSLAADPDQPSKLTITKTTPGQGRFAKPKTETLKVTPQEYQKDQLTKMQSMLEKWAADNPDKSAQTTAAIATNPKPETTPIDTRLAELYIAYALLNSCAYCHELKGQPAQLAPTQSDQLTTLPTGYHPTRTPHPTSKPTTTQHSGLSTQNSPVPPLSAFSLQPSALSPPSSLNPEPQTLNPPLPTPQGRLWFNASHFNHNPHQMLTCQSCHEKAPTSTQTKDVLLPTAQSCTTCHHPGSRESTAASNNCITCHTYHDRTKESH